MAGYRNATRLLQNTEHVIQALHPVNVNLKIEMEVTLQNGELF